MNRLKSSRKACAEAMAVDGAALKELQAKIADVSRRRNVIAKRLKEREELRERLQSQLDMVTEQFQAVLDATKGRTRSTRLTAARLMSKHASAELKAQRGFSTGRHEQPYSHKRRRKPSTAGGSSALSSAGSRVMSGAAATK